MKYVVVVVEGVESIFTFPRTVDHDRMHEAIEAIRFGSERNWSRKFREGEAIAAGFINEAGNCYGRSETLDLDSRGDADTALLRGVKATGDQQATDAAAYRFIRDDEYWQQNDRYWEAIRARGEALDKAIAGGIADAKARETEVRF